MEKITIYAGLEYQLIRRKNMKRIIISIKDGILHVSAPYNVSILKINQFVVQSKDAIEVMRERQKIKAEYKDGGVFKYLGKNYLIKVEDSSSCTCTIHGDYIFVHNQDIKKCLQIFMKQELYRVVMSIVNTYPLYRNQTIFIPEVVIKDLKSMYGVCYYNKDRIGISLRMIHEPIWVIEYVVVHELAHFIHQNHSKDFYSLIKEKLPNYKEAITYLKNGGY